MPIIFQFTQYGAIIATTIFFVCLVYCGLIALYLESEKNQKHLGWRISLIVALFICVYCEYCAVNIGFTIHPPKNATVKCVEK